MQNLQEYFKTLYSLSLKQVGNKKIHISKALNRILDSNFTCRIDIPLFDNSAMDGYAIKLGYDSYCIKGSIFAGENKNITLKNNLSYKIMTGAKIPKNTDAIVPKEYVKIKNDTFSLNINPKKNDCIKFRGEDFKKGEILLAKNTLITSNAIGILASQGVSEVCVKKKVKIIIFGSGNEVVNLDSKLGEFQIYDINSYFIKSVFSTLNCSISYGGILNDNLSLIKSKLKKALKHYDIVVTSGGVSVGDRDYIHEVLKEIKAEIIVDSIDMKPGRPLVLSTFGDKFILSLPGNPIGAFLQASFCLPILIQKMSGLDYYLGAKKATNQKSFKVSKQTTHIILGNLKDNKFYAYNDAKYQGGQISPLLKSNAMAIFHHKETINQGEVIWVLEFKPQFVNKLGRMFNVLN